MFFEFERMVMLKAKHINHIGTPLRTRLQLHDVSYSHLLQRIIAVI